MLVIFINVYYQSLKPIQINLCINYNNKSQENSCLRLLIYFTFINPCINSTHNQALITIWLRNGGNNFYLI